MTDHFAIEEWGSVANYEREMCGVDNYNSDNSQTDRVYLCHYCAHFDDPRCDKYPGMAFECFRRKHKCKHFQEDQL